MNEAECIEKLREALRFYADRDNWKTTGHPQIDAWDFEVAHDWGRKAREALDLCDIEYGQVF